MFRPAGVGPTSSVHLVFPDFVPDCAPPMYGGAPAWFRGPTAAGPVGTRPVNGRVSRRAYRSLGERGRVPAVGGTETRATLTVEEAAEVLGISRGLGYELVRTGELPSLRLGRRLVIPRRVVDELLASVSAGSVREPNGGRMSALSHRTGRGFESHHLHKPQVTGLCPELPSRLGASASSKGSR